jgi:citronellol/citronellal dehydrogenase
MAKYGMSMCVLGHADEFKADGIAVNGLWPRTVVATAAVQNLLGGDEMINVSRTPQIMADAAHCIFTRKSKLCSGNFFIDDEVLASEGYSEEKMRHYKVQKDALLGPDFFV